MPLFPYPGTGVTFGKSGVPASTAAGGALDFWDDTGLNAIFHLRTTDMANRASMHGFPALVLCLTVGAFTCFAPNAASAASAADPSASAAFAANSDIDRTLTRCLDAPEKQSTGAQDECIVDATHAWDVRLNASYRALQNDLPEASRPALLAAQRAWLASRDADQKLIAAVYATVRGTMYAPMNANDVMMLTKRRAQTLTRYAADLSYARAGEFRPMPAGEAKMSDIDAVTRRIERRLPASARGIVRASEGKWRAFMSAQTALIAAICPAGGAPGAKACRGAQRDAERAARMAQIEGLEGKIGAD
ncbi:hypothetical protein AB870_25905 [Pandoraea faecigallinarum]|uniref:Lysozyme inhibitor LprI-like N-terminal domain-containing protein n=1 Tax=Pandoraea faecigallinarum TaxID=656179 RepID=A0A173GZU9_9BURK|nr:lysozyme inhibitor LprI family protein [Pandoraea faecigallinarum]ANI21715.1 hypothetical protein AB870_25905 [Pandoraea faecigallinarum]